MTVPFRADLHCHSTCSDGSLTPEELIALAKDSDLQALSITDHDTANAYQTAPAAAAEAGILLVSGAEFSCVHNGSTVHLLAYSYPLGSPTIERLCQRHRTRRENRNLSILERLNRHKITLTVENLQAEARAGTMLGRPHIALALVRKGYVATIKEAFQRYLGDHAACYVQGEAITLEETIEIIHTAGAFAVLAHPHLLEGHGLISAVLELPLDGIEAYYGTFSNEDHQRWLKVAEKRGLLVTGGSDYHGIIRPYVSLGCSWSPQATFDFLYERFLHNNSNAQ